MLMDVRTGFVAGIVVLANDLKVRTIRGLPGRHRRQHPGAAAAPVRIVDHRPNLASAMTRISARVLGLGFLLATTFPVSAQPSGTTVIRASSMLDVVSGRLVPDAVVVVEGNRIAAAGSGLAVPEGARVVDLGDAVLLPGLIDAHTHLCIQPDYAANNPILYKSIPYRTAEAVAAARATLMAGFTTIRDVDSEGADWADVAVRDAIDDGVVPGPRMQVATRALSITGGYMNNDGLAPQIDVPQFGALVDSPEAIVEEIRREVKYGTDWIKLYATGTTRHINLEDMTPLPQFTREEIALVIREAERFRVPVAAHAYGGQGALDAVTLGVRSVDHGMLLDDRILDEMAARGTFWVPTISVYFGEGPRSSWDERTLAVVDAHRDTFGRALRRGVRIAYGTDAGALPHGANAIDFPVMVEYGMAPIDAIRSATVNAAELMDVDHLVGSIEAGMLADLIAVPSSPLDDVRVLGDVRFVMKDGVVYRNEK
jgi:imidazolonepropionase-like amidohydrolase